MSVLSRTTPADMEGALSNDSVLRLFCTTCSA